MMTDLRWGSTPSSIMADYKISRPVVTKPPRWRDQGGRTVVEDQCWTGSAARRNLSAGQRRDFSPSAFHPYAADFHWTFAVGPPRELGLCQTLPCADAN